MKELKTTTNRSVFNKVYKEHLNRTGKIKCNYCGYHKNENITHKTYYSYTGGNYKKLAKPPSWKLVSKNKKQWMGKPLKKKIFQGRYIDGFEFTW